jgi:hypothetical protein
VGVRGIVLSVWLIGIAGVVVLQVTKMRYDCAIIKYRIFGKALLMMDLGGNKKALP